MNAPFTALLPAPFRQRRLGSRRRHRRRGRRVGGVSRAIPSSPACGGRKVGGRHLRDRWVLGCDRERLLTPGRGGCWPPRRIAVSCPPSPLSSLPPSVAPFSSL